MTRIEKAHAGHFGRWAIGAEQHAQEKEIVRTQANVYGDVAKGARSLAATDDDLARIRARRAELEGALLPAAVALSPEAEAQLRQQLADELRAELLAELKADGIDVAPPMDEAAIRAELGAAGVTVLGVDEAGIHIDPATIADSGDEPTSPPYPPTATDRPAPPPFVDENNNGLPDEAETKGGYLRIADMPAVLEQQPELFGRLLELELGRADGGRKGAYLALHAAELKREGGPRAEVVAVLEPKL